MFDRSTFTESEQELLADLSFMSIYAEETRRSLLKRETPSRGCIDRMFELADILKVKLNKETNNV